MFKFLMQAAAGIATFNLGRRIADLKRSAAYFAVAGVFGLLGLGALVAAGIIYLAPRFGAAEAAAIVGGGLLALAALVGWAGTWRPRPRTPTPIFERVRAEVGAAGSSLSAAKTARPPRGSAISEDPDFPSPLRAPAQKRKRAINMVLLATLAGVILGRRL